MLNFNANDQIQHNATYHHVMSWACPTMAIQESNVQVKIVQLHDKDPSSTPNIAVADNLRRVLQLYLQCIIFLLDSGVVVGWRKVEPIFGHTVPVILSSIRCDIFFGLC